jgi:hypothetical protein
MHHLWTCPCKKCKRQNLQKPGMTQSPHINWREQEVHSELVIFYFCTCIPNMWEDQKLEQDVSASAALFCLTLTRCQIRLHVTSAGILYELQRQALGCNCSSLPLMFLDNFYTYYVQKKTFTEIDIWHHVTSVGILSELHSQTSGGNFFSHILSSRGVLINVIYPWENSSFKEWWLANEGLQWLLRLDQP